MAATARTVVLSSLLAVSLPALLPSTAVAQAEGSGVGDDVSNQVAALLVELVSLDAEQRGRRQQELLTSDPQAIEALHAALGVETVPMARRLAAWALGEANDAAACGYVASVADQLGDPGLEMALATARARCGDLEGMRQLLAADQPVAIRLRAAIMLGLLEDSASREPVFAMYDEFEATEDIAYVALAMGLYGESSTADVLERMLRQPQWRTLAAIALGRQGSDAVAFDLRFALDSDDPIVREMALRTMVARGLATDEQLTAVMADRSPRVAAYASSAGRR